MDKKVNVGKIATVGIRGPEYVIAHISDKGVATILLSLADGLKSYSVPVCVLRIFS